MNIKTYLFFTLMLTNISIHCADSLDKFYKTSFLKNYSTVKQELIKNDFQDISFITDDGLTLSGLFLSRPNARCNVIMSAGWYPGKKEGMATFYALLPDYCNILFFDARGRGNSEGPFLRDVWRYGVNEYKDIIGAVAYINKKNELPIIVGGLCAGAFNATHALVHLEKNNILAQSRIKGLIIDSGWGSVVKTTRTNGIANINKAIIMVLNKIYKTKERSQNSYLYKILSTCNSYCSTIIHRFCAGPLFARHDHITNLTDKIHNIKCPLFFIHSYDDTYAVIDEAITLSNLVSNKECWWIEKSYHTMHHIIHKELYKEKLAAFINTCLQPTT